MSPTGLFVPLLSPLTAEADFQKWWVKSAMSTMMVTGTPKA